MVLLRMHKQLERIGRQLNIMEQVLVNQHHLMATVIAKKVITYPFNFYFVGVTSDNLLGSLYQGRKVPLV